MEKTLGGNRLGAGKKMQVELRQFERSTHDLGSIWRSTMASGTLVPMMAEIGLPGDTWDMEFDIDIQTKPTIGPLFGSFKVQLDVFSAPIRLYNAILMNNQLGIGMKMNSVYLPQVKIEGNNIDPEKPLDGQQINPSAIFAYLGMRGIGREQNGGDEVARIFNALHWLMYWEVYKNYYANKQEEIGYVIHNDVNINTNIFDIQQEYRGVFTVIPKSPATGAIGLTRRGIININYTTGIAQNDTVVMVEDITDNEYNLIDMYEYNNIVSNVKVIYEGLKPQFYNRTWKQWRYATQEELQNRPPKLTQFNLSDIDDMRRGLQSEVAGPYVIQEATTVNPYKLALEASGTGTRIFSATQTQEGLGIKTYQSDMFNNWLQTEWIEGSGSVNELSAISVTGGFITIDQINIAEKVYKMLNAVAASGGSYDDWQDAIWNHNRPRMVASPVYEGGLSKELVFQEVVSTAASTTSEEPLGTLAGKGRMSGKHKGGKVIIKVDEPSVLLGIVSLTPRIDYSQGNRFYVNLKTLDDLHKPALDQIGFQDLITDQMAYWDTRIQTGTGNNLFNSAGKQPAWINYMTAVNEVYGNFALENSEMFMVLNRRYEQNKTTGRIKDLTTYIDPMKFNYIFAETSRDAMNFWVQIRKDITARRKMSAKVMPNL